MQQYGQYDRHPLGHNILKVYNIADISQASYTWLVKIQKELKECIDILKRNKAILNILGRQFFSSDSKKVDSIQTQVDFCIALGEEIYNKTERVMKMPVDLDTVIFLFHAEENYLFFWGVETIFSANTSLIDIGPVDVVNNHRLLSNVAKGSVKYIGKTFPGMICFRYKLSQNVPRDNSKWSKLHGKQCSLLSQYYEMF